MALLLILLALFGFVLGGTSETSSSASASRSVPQLVAPPPRAHALKKGCTKVRIIKGASSQPLKPHCLYLPVSP